MASNDPAPCCCNNLCNRGQFTTRGTVARKGCPCFARGSFCSDACRCGPDRQICKNRQIRGNVHPTNDSAKDSVQSSDHEFYEKVIKSMDARLPSHMKAKLPASSNSEKLTQMSTSEDSDDVIIIEDLCQAPSSVCSDFKIKKEVSHNKKSEPEVYRCPICAREFRQPEVLDFHMHMHSGTNLLKSLPLDATGKTLQEKLHSQSIMKWKTKFDDRNNVVHAHHDPNKGGQKKKCRFCNKSFDNAKDLETHKKVHEDKLYECNVCSKRFSVKESMRLHKKLHTKPLPSMPETPGGSGKSSRDGKDKNKKSSSNNKDCKNSITEKDRKASRIEKGRKSSSLDTVKTSGTGKDRKRNSIEKGRRTSSIERDRKTRKSTDQDSLEMDKKTSKIEKDRKDSSIMGKDRTTSNMNKNRRSSITDKDGKSRSPDKNNSSSTPKDKKTSSRDTNKNNSSAVKTRRNSNMDKDKMTSPKDKDKKTSTKDKDKNTSTKDKDKKTSPQVKDKKASTMDQDKKTSTMDEQKKTSTIDKEKKTGPKNNNNKKTGPKDEDKKTSTLDKDKKTSTMDKDKTTSTKDNDKNTSRKDKDRKRSITDKNRESSTTGKHRRRSSIKDHENIEVCCIEKDWKYSNNQPDEMISSCNIKDSKKTVKEDTKTEDNKSEKDSTVKSSDKDCSISDKINPPQSSLCDNDKNTSVDVDSREGNLNTPEVPKETEFSKLYSCHESRKRVKPKDRVKKHPATPYTREGSSYGKDHKLNVSVKSLFSSKSTKDVTLQMNTTDCDSPQSDKNVPIKDQCGGSVPNDVLESEPKLDVVPPKPEEPKAKCKSDKRTCSLCGKRFAAEVYLKNHMNKVHPSGNVVVDSGERFQCGICGQGFHNNQNLGRHHSTFHLGKLSHKCHFCNKNFSHQHNYNKHKCVLDENNPGNEISAPKNTNISNSVSHKPPVLLKNKNTKNHTGIKLTLKGCDSSQPDKNVPLTDQCGGSVPNDVLESEPKLDVVPPKPEEPKAKCKSDKRTCTLCGKRFATETYLKNHINKVHPSGNVVVDSGKHFQCGICGQGFHNKQNLGRHHSTFHLGKLSHKCHICKKTFSHQHYYAKHKCVLDENNPGNEISAPKNTNISNSASHKPPISLKNKNTKNHTGIKLTLKGCDSSQPDKNVPLKDQCGGSVPDDVLESEPKLDVVSPKPEEPKAKCKSDKRTCTLCGKRFATETYLKNHINTVHPSGNVVLDSGKRFQCGICGQGFHNNQNLERHHSTFHLGQLSHKCSVCNKTFSHQHNYTQHKCVLDENNPGNEISAPKNTNIANSASHKPPISLKNKSTKNHTGIKLTLKRSAFMDALKFKSKRRKLQSPNRSHSLKVKLFNCTLCTHTYRSAESLRTHITTHSQDTKVSSDSCCYPPISQDTCNKVSHSQDTRNKVSTDSSRYTLLSQDTHNKVSHSQDTCNKVSHSQDTRNKVSTDSSRYTLLSQDTRNKVSHSQDTHNKVSHPQDTHNKVSHPQDTHKVSSDSPLSQDTLRTVLGNIETPPLPEVWMYNCPSCRVEIEGSLNLVMHIKAHLEMANC